MMFSLLKHVKGVTYTSTSTDLSKLVLLVQSKMSVNGNEAENLHSQSCILTFIFLNSDNNIWNKYLIEKNYTPDNIFFWKV
jgi:hypothetical protein